MPSPVGHSLMGYIIYLLHTTYSNTKKWQVFVFCLIVANIPDLDFLPGAIIEDLRRFHHGISHSITFSILFGLLIGYICYLKKIEQVKRAFTLGLTLYLSHILLDYLVLSGGRGVPLFWPFFDNEYMISFVVFPYFDYMSPEGKIFGTLFSLYNLKTITIEILLLIPLLTVAILIRHSKPRK
ncbi:MAG: metal-dependent hydrolase [Nitrospirota bacterium]